MTSISDSQCAEQMTLLWQQYKVHCCQKARARLIEQHAYLCRITAQRLVRGMPTQIDVEDMVGAGHVGLVKAVELFDPARGVRFSTYAIAMIRGAILDMLREEDWVPRLVRDQEKQLALAEDRFERQHGRLPNEAELAACLHWTSEYLDGARRAVERTRLMSLEGDVRARPDDKPQPLADMLADDDPAVFEQVWSAERRRLLWKAVARLPEREARIARLYYGENRTFKEIGQQLGVSESRAYQLHTQALNRLRMRLGSKWEGC